MKQAKQSIQTEIYLYPRGRRTYAGTATFDTVEQFVKYVDSIMFVEESDLDISGAFEMYGSMPLDESKHLGSMIDAMIDTAPKIDLRVSGDPVLVALAWEVRF